jgi:hypothetical protein
MLRRSSRLHNDNEQSNFCQSSAMRRSGGACGGSTSCDQQTTQGFRSVKVRRKPIPRQSALSGSADRPTSHRHRWVRREMGLELARISRRAHERPQWVGLTRDDIDTGPTRVRHAASVLSSSQGVGAGNRGQGRPIALAVARTPGPRSDIPSLQPSIGSAFVSRATRRITSACAIRV